MEYLIAVPFLIVFVFFVGILIIGIIRGIYSGIKNGLVGGYNKLQPIESRRSTIIEKRAYSNIASGGAGTQYYATFQFDDGNREEHMIEGRDYGLLLEGDVGQLKFQGSAYIGFERDKNTTY